MNPTSPPSVSPPTQETDRDTKRGLYSKYFVQRLGDVRDVILVRRNKHGDPSAERVDPPAKHAGCRYYVLDLEHDRFAGPALRAYAAACAAEFPALAADLRALSPSPSPSSPSPDAPRSEVLEVTDCGGEPLALYVRGHVAFPLFWGMLDRSGPGQAIDGELRHDAEEAEDARHEWWRAVPCDCGDHGEHLKPAVPADPDAFAVTVWHLEGDGWLGEAAATPPSPETPADEMVHRVTAITQRALCSPPPGPYRATLDPAEVTCPACRAASPETPAPPDFAEGYRTGLETAATVADRHGAATTAAELRDVLASVADPFPGVPAPPRAAPPCHKEQILKWIARRLS